MPQFSRTQGVLDLELVSSKSIAIVGLGSLGSHVVGLLAFPWKQLILIDPDKLAPENVERHYLDYEYVGRYKVNGIKRRLVRGRHLEADRIRTHRTTVDRVIDRCPQVDLVIETTGIPQVRRLLSAWSYDTNTPVIFAGIYPKGIGGQLVAIINPHHSCWQCYDINTGGSANLTPVQNYGIGPANIDPDTGELAGIPYLIGPVASIAADVQDVALDLIAGVEMPNHWLIHTHKSKALYQIPNGSLAEVGGYWEEAQQLLGLIPTQQIRPDSNGGFTMHGSRAIIQGIIQPSGGCSHHFSAALQPSPEGG